jgi:DNA-directed RNA polymerase I subunit RPA1
VSLQQLTPASRRKRMQPGERVKTELNATEMQEHFRQLWGRDHEILCYLFPVLREIRAPYPTDVLFVETLAVPPPKTRPCQFTGGIMTIHPQSSGLQFVLETIMVMKHILRVMRGENLDYLPAESRELIQTMKGEKMHEKLDIVWKELQSNVDHVLDKDMKSGANVNNVGWGFKQLIERKQGLFRMHMMGKRVNFAARTVITPDPNICIDEIGLPDVFAKGLTYREPVTAYNVDMLRQMVMNGPDVHPGKSSCCCRLGLFC